MPDEPRFCFFDWETMSDLDLTEVGTLRYVLDPSTEPLLLSWGVNDDPIKLWVKDLSDELAPEVWAYVMSRVWCYGPGKAQNIHGGMPFKGLPAEITDVAYDPNGYFVAWNCAFDRQVCQQIATPELGFPDLKVDKFLDAMSQGQASNLPGSLDMAGRALGLGTKTLGGKAVMKRFADRSQPLPGSRELIDAAYFRGKDIEEAIEAWSLYLDYSLQDTELLRDVWRVTRPLDGTEWQEYWVSEKINDRGMLADLQVCLGAVQYREEEAAFIEEECKRITNGVIAKPTLTAQINPWLFERLPDDLAEIMVASRDEDGNVARLTGAKDVITRLLEDIDASDTPPDDDVIEFLELLQYGRSSSAIKFEKILNQHVDGRLTNSYAHNGAGQTGRFSSRGVQVHNLVRDAFKNELDILDMVASGVPIEELRKIGPVSSVLSKLIRPTFIAPEKKLFVWGDWSAIEARVTPWLADSRDADRAVLEPFRQSDADPSLPDVYILNAADVFKVYPDVLWERYKNGDPQAKSFRQGGKVMVLSLGFRGSVGALMKMARNYGIRLTREEAKVWVDGWRDRNRWNKRFADKAQEAAFAAMRSPLTAFKAGKLTYQFMPGIVGGTLFCWLPDMRPIIYPRAKISRIEKFGQEQDAITYLNGMGRRALWNGLQLENGTQATAASILRQTLVRIEAEKPDHLVGHTHDEVINEVDEDEAWAFADYLEAAMVRGFDWSAGLPLAAEVEVNWYYTKNKGMTRPD